MAGVEIATLGWGVLQDERGNKQSGLTPTISGTVYTDQALTIPLPAASWTSQSDGTLPGYMASGQYTFTEPVDGTSRIVDVVGGDTIASAVQDNLDDYETATDARLAIVEELPPNVEQGAYEALRTGNDWTASFEAIRNDVDAGGMFGMGARTYELNEFTLSSAEQFGRVMQGQGLNTVLTPVSGADFVVQVDTTVMAGLRDIKVDGGGAATDGVRVRSLVGGGLQSQAQLMERVWVEDCTRGFYVFGASAEFPTDACDKNTFLGCSAVRCDVGFETHSTNSQQQVWIGGHGMADCDLDWKMGGGSLLVVGTQGQNNAGTGKIMEMTSANFFGATFRAYINEGYDYGFDCTAGHHWPDQGIVIADQSVIQTDIQAALIDRGGVPCGLTVQHSYFRGAGTIVLQGNDTWLDIDPHSILESSFGTGQNDALVSITGNHCRYIKRRAWPEWREVGAASQPAFENSWVNFGAPQATAGFWIDPAGTVHLKGTVKSGTIGTNVFTLPAAYRPAASRRFAVISNGALGSVSIDSAGGVLAQTGNNAYIGLGCSFPTG